MKIRTGFVIYLAYGNYTTGRILGTTRYEINYDLVIMDI